MEFYANPPSNGIPDAISSRSPLQRASAVLGLILVQVDSGDSLFQRYRLQPMQTYLLHDKDSA